MHGKIQNSYLINHLIVIYKMSRNVETIELRKVQALTGERSLTLVFPKQVATELGIERGDFMECRIDGGKLIVERMKG
jgi:hypothetical protein